MSEVISVAESARLVELESVVSRGIQSFIEVGEALCEIRDSRLYRIEHGTFEEYCREKWGMSLPRAKQLIGASLVNQNLRMATMVAKPETERQVRPLTKLEPEQQPKAWERAVEIAGGEQPTAKQVEQAVVQVISADKAAYPSGVSAAVGSVEAGDAAAKESETLWLLKSAWRKAPKKDRAAFVAWINNQP